MSIRATIKKLRRDRNITREQLAEMLGISTNAVSQWECVKTAPDISHLPVLANILRSVLMSFLKSILPRAKSNPRSKNLQPSTPNSTAKAKLKKG